MTMEVRGDEKTPPCGKVGYRAHLSSRIGQQGALCSRPS